MIDGLVAGDSDQYCLKGGPDPLSPHLDPHMGIMFLSKCIVYILMSLFLDDRHINGLI